MKIAIFIDPSRADYDTVKKCDSTWWSRKSRATSQERLVNLRNFFSVTFFPSIKKDMTDISPLSS